MSKKKKKGGKKADDANKSEPIKTRMQILFETYLQVDSLTLSQQKFIVSTLSLRNDSLYDSMIIDIITDILQYFKQLSLSAIQSEHIYYILQNVLYKLMNDHNCNLDTLTNYLHKQLSQRIKPHHTDQNNDTQSDKQSNSESTEYISSEISHKIACFLEQRILSQYQLYRIALFENNPSNIKYIEFKKVFEIDDIIKFQDKDCVFKVAEFRPNDIVVHCLHDDFKSINPENDNQKDIPVNYYVSRDQLQFISFVSKSKVSQEEEVNAESVISNENKDTSNKENKENDEKHDISEPTNEETNTIEKSEKNNDEPNKESVTKESPKTLIDVIVDRKVQDKLKLMQQKFDTELEQYKQQIDKLNNVTRSDA